MVLWEIAAVTAYFLGLKRTYRLAFKIQRRLISPNHPRLQQFVERRTRAVFDVALKVNKSIQHRDLEVGRNLGNWILRWLHTMKPSVQIRAPIHQKPHSDVPKQVGNSTSLKMSPRNYEAGRHLFRSSMKMWSNSFPTIAMMMRTPSAAGNMTQCRHLSSNRPDTLTLNYVRGGVIRKDILQWMSW